MRLCMLHLPLLFVAEIPTHCLSFPLFLQTKGCFDIILEYVTRRVLNHSAPTSPLGGAVWAWTGMGI